VDLFGVGYGSGPSQLAIPSALTGERPLDVLVALAGLKILATSVTIGSGGSGGVFAPSLFMGAMIGGAFGNLVNNAWPDISAPSGAYAMVGMAAVFAGAARAPITAILILFEMTREYSIILPLMIAVVTSTAVAQIISRDTIYTLKLRRRGIEFVERREESLLAAIWVGRVMTRHLKVVRADAPPASCWRCSPARPLERERCRWWTPAEDWSGSSPLATWSGRWTGISPISLSETWRPRAWSPCVLIRPWTKRSGS